MTSVAEAPLDVFAPGLDLNAGLGEFPQPAIDPNAALTLAEVAGSADATRRASIASGCGTIACAGCPFAAECRGGAIKTNDPAEALSKAAAEPVPTATLRRPAADASENGRVGKPAQTPAAAAKSDHGKGARANTAETTPPHPAIQPVATKAMEAKAASVKAQPTPDTRQTDATFRLRIHEEAAAAARLREHMTAANRASTAAPVAPAADKTPVAKSVQEQSGTRTKRIDSSLVKAVTAKETALDSPAVTAVTDFEPLITSPVSAESPELPSIQPEAVAVSDTPMRVPGSTRPPLAAAGKASTKPAPKTPATARHRITAERPSERIKSPAAAAAETLAAKLSAKPEKAAAKVEVLLSKILQHENSSHSPAAVRSEQQLITDTIGALSELGIEQAELLDIIQADSNQDTVRISRLTEILTELQEQLTHSTGIHDMPWYELDRQLRRLRAHPAQQQTGQPLGVWAMGVAAMLLALNHALHMQKEQEQSSLVVA